MLELIKKTRRSRKLSRSDGSAMLETALTIGITLTVLLALIDFSMFMWKYGYFLHSFYDFNDEISAMRPPCATNDTLSSNYATSVREIGSDVGMEILANDVNVYLNNYTVWAMKGVAEVTWKYNCISCSILNIKPTIKFRDQFILENCGGINITPEAE